LLAAPRQEAGVPLVVEQAAGDVAGHSRGDQREQLGVGAVLVPQRHLAVSGVVASPADRAVERGIAPVDVADDLRGEQRLVQHRREHSAVGAGAAGDPDS
jgi:hypothetical protein